MSCPRATIWTETKFDVSRHAVMAKFEAGRPPVAELDTLVRGMHPLDPNLRRTFDELFHLKMDGVRRSAARPSRKSRPSLLHARRTQGRFRSLHCRSDQG